MPSEYLFFGGVGGGLAHTAPISRVVTDSIKPTVRRLYPKTPGYPEQPELQAPRRGALDFFLSFSETVIAAESSDGLRLIKTHCRAN